MKSQRLQSLIASGESETLEFKSGNASAESVARSICAFLNLNGGRVLMESEINVNLWESPMLMSKYTVSNLSYRS
jgi:hypothetical protein